jgi:hypothetical protein
MKPLVLCVVLFCAPVLLAQEKRPAPEQPAQTQEQAQTRATPAPQLGHPLDPADVDVLTGKTKTSANCGYRVDPLSYGYGYAYAGAQRYEGYGWGRTPFLFGRTGGGSFFFFGNAGFFAPRFLGPGRGGIFFRH